jgi:hypothetical protein
MPTSHLRAWAARLMRGLYGLDRALLQDKVFSVLEMAEDLGLIF